MRQTARTVAIALVLGWMPLPAQTGCPGQEAMASCFQLRIADGAQALAGCDPPLGALRIALRPGRDQGEVPRWRLRPKVPAQGVVRVRADAEPEARAMEVVTGHLRF